MNYMNFPKCFRQNKSDRPFIKNFATRINLCCLQQVPLNQFLIKNLSIDEMRCLHFCRMENDARAYW